MLLVALDVCCNFNSLYQLDTDSKRLVNLSDNEMDILAAICCTVFDGCLVELSQTRKLSLHRCEVLRKCGLKVSIF
jgi:hypothetical protein